MDITVNLLHPVKLQKEKCVVGRLDCNAGLCKDHVLLIYGTFSHVTWHYSEGPFPEHSSEIIWKLDSSITLKNGFPVIILLFPNFLVSVNNFNLKKTLPVCSVTGSGMGFPN